MTKMTYMSRRQLRALLDQLGISQQAAADKLGVSLSTSQRWARNGADGPAAVLFNLLASGTLSLADLEDKS